MDDYCEQPACCPMPCTQLMIGLWNALLAQRLISMPVRPFDLPLTQQVLMSLVCAAVSKADISKHFRRTKSPALSLTSEQSGLQRSSVSSGPAFALTATVKQTNAYAETYNPHSACLKIRDPGRDIRLT